jgi:predicted nuclease with TOPRIM domain
MQALEQLNSKLNTLLKKHTALETENKRLRETIARQEKTEKSLSRKLDSLEHGMVSVHLGKAVSNDEDKENMRQQLDTVIADIDRILNTLND